MPFNLNIDTENININTSKKSRDLLYGTGLTQKQAKKADTSIRRAEKQETQLNEKPVVETLDKKRLDLPLTLIDASLKPDEFQQRAIDVLVNEKYGVIIGAAGTGKSFTIKLLLQAIMQVYRDSYLSFSAYTGRAVEQIKRNLPPEYHMYCDTIHGLLEYKPVSVFRDPTDMSAGETIVFRPTRTEYNPLVQNVIILDEGGMIPIDLMNNLIAACKEDTRIFILGDINQLPPVQGRSVLGFSMQKWPCFELQRIHRTEENSIIDGAWNILNGKMPQTAPGKIILQRINTDSRRAFRECCAVINKMYETGSYVPLRDAIIVPTNDEKNISNLGQIQFNERLVSVFNKSQYASDGKTILNPRIMIKAGELRTFAVGDKIMATTNDRDNGITNGMVGVITNIKPNEKYKGQAIANHVEMHINAENIDVNFADDFHLTLQKVSEIRETNKNDAEEITKQASHTLTVQFQNIQKPLEFSSVGAVRSLKHAYAFTCHKSQGGEYPTVIIICHSANSILLCREWLYTAWTRAQERIVLLFNNRGLQQALTAQRIIGNTIEEKAKKFIELNDRSLNGDESIKIPNLPEQSKINIPSEGLQNVKNETTTF